MCGRYTLRASPKAIAKAFGLDDVPEIPARFNVAPTRRVPVVRLDAGHGGRELSFLKWVPTQ
jgi:putative SOS response-associated peptidase YedK